jgi:hypothetical protein
VDQPAAFDFGPAFLLVETKLIRCGLRRRRVLGARSGQVMTSASAATIANRSMAIMTAMLRAPP